MLPELPRAWLLPMLFAAANGTGGPAANEAPIALTAAATASPGEPAANAAADAVALPAAVEARVGPYRLLEEIGRGAMGVVWLAEQDAPASRRVALKVLRPDRQDEQALARFATEVAAMARVQHEHVAHLYDAGVTPDGRPWLAMELIEGVAVTDHCAGFGLDQEARLQLFLAIGEAVVHLHGSGVRHGDLKPDNILVVHRPGGPIPKLVDFGLAGLAHGPRFDQDAVAGTPAYMAPEHFTLPSAAIDERSDVFALGVVLHELLTGTLPPTAARCDEGGGLQVVLEHERGSAAVHPDLDGHLARIVARALAGRREDRYPTVAALLADLRHSMVHEAKIRRWLSFGIAGATAATIGFMAGALAGLL